MTDLLTPDLDTGPGEGTQNLTYRRLAPPRRPDATGEIPVYAPQTIAVVDRAVSDETLVLPVGAEPAPSRAVVPTVYLPAARRPRRYRGARRMVEPAPAWWAGLVVGACWAAALESALLIVAMAATR